jgi:hypothetical protein
MEMFEQTTNREQLARTLFELEGMPFPPYVTRGVMRLKEQEASAFLATLQHIRQLPEAGSPAEHERPQDHGGPQDQGGPPEAPRAPGAA